MSENNGSNHLGPHGEPHSAPSEKKVQANQRNAMQSTGPQTPEGKARSSQNARKHGLTGVFPITTGDGKEDCEAFEDLRIGLYDYWKPEGRQEEHLVELLAGDYWRLQRADRHEAGMTRKSADHATNDWQLRRTRNFYTTALTADLGFPFFVGETCQVIDHQIEFLTGIQERLEHGLDLEEKLLTTIQGLFSRPGPCFAKTCVALWTTIQQYRKEQRQEAAAQCQKELMDAAAQKIQSLQEARKIVAAREKSELEAQLLTVSLPPWPVVDKLDRHMTKISRRIERTMNQLMRLQQWRKTSPPRVSAEVSVKSPLPQASADEHTVSLSETPSVPESGLHVIVRNNHES